ncbi:MAG: hypothetical protein AAF358_13655 [Pseudomonadota bacterium]
MHTENVAAADRNAASVQSNASVVAQAVAKQVYGVVARNARGEVLWEDKVFNLITTVGLTDLLEQYFRGSGYTASHFMGLTDGTPTVAAGDTMASHAGWVEVTDYANATRRAMTFAAASAASISNTGFEVVFTINATVTVGGLFITTSNVKGGTAGILYAGGPFSGGDRSLVNLDTVTCTFTNNMSSS